MTVRTRFAPSPTGYLHIGGVRTALFNWLFARRHRGKFILRIDDTDTERNRPEALQPILDGFRWLGITWDEGPEAGGPHGPYFQSQRGQLYRDAALKLLDAGFAYPDYSTAEQREALKKQAEAEKRSTAFRGEHRTLPASEARRLYDRQPTALRLKVPADRIIAIDDLIVGRVEVNADTVADPVILRADGSALYNFATVIDDRDLAITHVIRAKEHLSNTPVQLLVYEALSATPPRFAHVPVVNAPDSNKKLSKRDAHKFMTAEVITRLRAVHAVPADWTDEQVKKNEQLNPVMVSYYQTLGYLPAALVNYFGRLGWSLDDKTEIMSLQTMIENFSLERVNDSPARFDPKKLEWVAGEYTKAAPLDRKIEGVLPILRRAGLVGESVDPATRDRVRRVVEACGDRLAIFSDILQYGAFFFRAPEYDPKAVKQRLQKEGIPALLREAAQVLAAVEPFEAPVLEAKVKALCEAKGAKFGDLNHALRVATTGVMVGPGVFECLAIFGKDETLRRIDAALKLI
jgi:nondiscriminating glutamyl-tRNA synthetase